MFNSQTFSQPEYTYSQTIELKSVERLRSLIRRETRPKSVQFGCSRPDTSVPDEHCTLTVPAAHRHRTKHLCYFLSDSLSGFRSCRQFTAPGGCRWKLPRRAREGRMGSNWATFLASRRGGPCAPVSEAASFRKRFGSTNPWGGLKGTLRTAAAPTPDASTTALV